jgi:HD domain
MSYALSFDELAITAAEREAVARLREATGVEGPIERHCLRCRHIAAELARRRGWIIEGEVVTVAAALHDIGAYLDPAARQSTDAYVADGAAVARSLLAAHSWTPARIDRCADAIERHHELRRQLARGAEVEALRLADLVDISGGLLRFGLPRQWVRELRQDVPVDGWGAEVARIGFRMVRERPATVPRIFRRG